MLLLERLKEAVLHNTGTKAISLVIAIVLWMIVLGSRNIEVTKEVPLEVITAPDITVANELPERVAFRLSGPKAFLRAIVDRREDPIRINLSGSQPNLVTYRFFSDNIRIPPGVRVLAINPTAVLIKLEKVRRRDVPVKVEVRGTPPEGYRIAGVQAMPPSVKLKGPESKIEGITEVATTPIDVSAMTEPTTLDASLQLERTHVKVDGDLPKVTVQIEPIAANFRIRNVELRVLSDPGKRARTVARSVTVHVRASAETLKTLDRSQVYATVDVRGRAKGKHQEDVRVSLPPGVSLVKTIPEEVTVTVP